MTSRAGREQKQNQRGVAAGYNDAAAAHDQAARMHEGIAKHYDIHGKPAQAMRERRKAAQELQNAVADRKRAATLTAEARRDLRNSSDKSDRPGPYGADLAALLGATIAVLLTLTFGPGAWGPLSTIIGSLLLVILLAFFWGRRPEAEPLKNWRPPFSVKSWKSFFRWKKWDLLFVGVVLSAVVGLVWAITSAEAIQKGWFSDNGNRFECRSVAVAQAVMAVHALNVTDTDIRPGTLQQLIKETLQKGEQQSNGRQQSTTQVPTNPDATLVDAALKYAFHNEYESAEGDCLANETTDSLWLIGILCGSAALVWWNWSFIFSLFSYMKRSDAKI